MDRDGEVRWEGGGGEEAGFSITVPNWEKVDWVRISTGMRRLGDGILVGILKALALIEGTFRGKL